MNRDILNVIGALFIGSTVIIITALYSITSVEPLERYLPERYKNGGYEIYRYGAISYIVCLKVQLDRDEIDHFIQELFERESRDRHLMVDDLETGCGSAPFWPISFADKTLAYEVNMTPDGNHIRSSRGIVYQDGFAYYWSYV
ncbi:hypothetical protein DYI37_18600 [Fulvimarina endophytica]|uniref:Uncharacterized protein n=1 Tax=Fulvimarina endophytica TaxID=2293836 RepID=A0A371WYA7_9HYPH|nr:hypothetical protein [Fulvimarina endophytica]RFC61939.1 hypothetical protein DYI37_18600 [Fulvimarina endophytica]